MENNNIGKITFNDGGEEFEFSPSKYQKDIFDFVEHGHGNLVIEAVAGAGKTTTIINCLKLIPEGKRVLFAAFNKDIVETLKDKIGNKHKNVNITTLHSLGYKMLFSNLGDDYNLELDEFKYKTYIQKNINELAGFDVSSLQKRKRNKYINNITKLVDFGRYYLVSTKKKMADIIQRYELEVLFNEDEVALDVIKWGEGNLNTVDFTDMVYLPNALNLNPVGFLYDYIFLDEVQDLNRAQRHLFQKCVKINTRFFACGDPNQCIYSFSGSDPESFSQLLKISNTVKMPLSICYRCADKIVANAKRFVPEIEPNDRGECGTIEREVDLGEVQDGDMVLCRNNMPLVQLYERFIRDGKKCKIKGKDIGENLKELILETGADELYDDNGEGVFSILQEDLVSLKEYIMKDKDIDEHTAKNSSQFLDRFDKVRAIEILGEHCTTLQSLLDHIDEVFSDNDIDGITLSTVHKSKGLESGRVFIACDSLMPSKAAKLPWEKQQEHNLQYVAYTRAKSYLGFLSETDFHIDTDTRADESMRRIEKTVEAIRQRRNYRQSGTVEYAPLIIEHSEDPLNNIPTNGGTLGERKKETTDGFLPKKRLKKKIIL